LTNQTDETLVTPTLVAPDGLALTLVGDANAGGVVIDTLTVTTLIGPTIDESVTPSVTAPASTALTLTADAGFGVLFSPATGEAATNVLVGSAPTAPASTSAFKMQGLAGTITPQHTGTVLVIVSGTLTSATVTAGDGITYQISYGTGSAPANAGTLAGTQAGPIQVYKNPATVTAADVAVPFSVSTIITGLTLNTAYWLDLAAKSVGTASSGGVGGVSIVAVEIH
jgi:hypothetical protein